jgi:hypothetical protein
MGEPLLLKSWRCTNLLIALACAPGLMAADWLPLETGNQWVYRGSGTRQTEPLVLRVGEAREFAGHTYYQLQGLPEGSYWLRNDGDRVVQWKEDTGTDALWYNFFVNSQGFVGIFQTALPGMPGPAYASNRKEAVVTPVGTFIGGVEITIETIKVVRNGYALGTTKDVFVNGVGMLTRTETGRGGYELVYARLGASTILKGPENGIQLSLNEDKTWARLQVDAQQPSGKVLRLYDESGSEVWSWSSERKGFSVTGDPNVELPAMKPGPYVLTAECGDARISLPFTVQ